MEFPRLQGGQEFICMNVDKVYDWVVTQANFTLSVPNNTPISFTGTIPTNLDGAVTTCEVELSDTNPIRVLNREDQSYIIDREEVTLQVVTIEKNFNVILFVTVGGVSLTSTSTTPLTFSRLEQVLLCAPSDTNISISIPERSCIVDSTGILTGNPADNTIIFSNLSASVTLCQSIQSTYPVTVEFLAEFCQPRDIFQTSCPVPVIPPQCPLLFPDLPIPPPTG